LSTSVDINNSAINIKASRFHRPYHSASPVRDLANAERAMHKGYTLVPLLEQMSGSKFASSNIIDRNRAKVLDAAWPVEQNNGNASLPEPL
jgi:hypothetical protein